MSRSIALVAVACSLLCVNTRADDYLLSVKTRESVNNANDNPQWKVLRQMEVVVRPDAAFHLKLAEGKETLTFSGKLVAVKGGAFEARVKYTRSIKQSNGTQKPAYHVGRFNTAARISEGDSLNLGGLQFIQRDAPQPKLTTTSYVLTLKKFDPDAVAADGVE